RAIELLSWGPARIFGLPGGRLEVGAPADVTVIDPDLEWEIDANRFASKGRNTPFHGWKVRGRAVQTLVGGKIVHEIGARAPLRPAPGGTIGVLAASGEGPG